MDLWKLVKTSKQGWKKLLNHGKKIFWATSIFLATAISLVILKSILDYDIKRNVKLVTDSINAPIWFYPFPAITVCNFNQISKKRLFKEIKHFKNPYNISEKIWQKLFQGLINMHLLYRGHYQIKDLNLLQEILDYNNITAGSLIQKVAPTCDEIMLKCFWKNEERYCNLLFKEVMTSYGRCCAFNMFAFGQDETFKYGPNSKPRYATSCGVQSGLFVICDNNLDDYFASMLPAYGYMVLVHNSYETLGEDAPRVMQPLSTLIYINVDPTFSTLSRRSTNFIKSGTNCLFEDERQMKFFQKYSSRNCIYECRLLRIIDICNCIPSYVAKHNDEFSAVPECTLRDVPCMKRTYFYKNCTCQPNCEHYEYSVSFSVGTLSTNYTPAAKLKILKENQTVFAVVFKDLSAVRNRYVFTFEWQVMFSLSGGILSLFTGFSFKAVLQMIYFLIIHTGKKCFQKIQNNNGNNNKKSKPTKLTKQFIYQN
ncbi:hypothetical protein RN001_007414 [Aquatica leii]|uniref:Sodium channel protein Nach n=1 Tax=Aquatica leii TaxID=1421715 RepID=A0AAN7SNV4_9COLE|nr:hypothetical protein RN001_007414 [Aquatica leii]